MLRACNPIFRLRPMRVRAGVRATPAPWRRAAKQARPAAANRIRAAATQATMDHSAWITTAVGKWMTSTTTQQYICPRRKTVSLLSPVGNVLSDSSVNAASGYVGNNWQHIDPPSQTGDAILSVAIFSTPAARLSARIYKICTPPSTGIVDNVVARTSADARRALRGAVFRGPPYSPS